MLERIRFAGRGKHRMRIWLAATAALVWLGCSDVRLEFPDVEQAPNAVDDQLDIDGAFCTSRAVDVVYPVKIMFIVDGSGSQQFADQNRQRVVAVANAIGELIGSSNTFFKVVVFNASITATPSNNGNPPPPVFTNQLSEITPALANLAEADTVTDYQGAFSVAYSELVRDMEDVRIDPNRGYAELARTKYIVVFISDGFPDPLCQAGLGNDFDPNFPGGVNLLCEDQEYLACLLEAGLCGNGTLCNGSMPCTDGTNCSGQTTCGNFDANGNEFCDFNGTLCYRAENAQNLFGGLANLELAAGADYNQPYQILQRVEDIMKLQERYQVGELRVHSGLVLDPLADPAIIAIFGDTTKARPLMQQIAETGEGRYLEFYGGDSISFDSLDFDSLKQQRVVRGFFAHNMGSRYDLQGLVPDSDYDGLPDALEFEIGTKPTKADSDGDGYSDFLEWTKRGFAFDPNDPCKPAILDPNLTGDPASCVAADPNTWVSCNYDPVGPTGRTYVDLDRDGLNDCEELALRTNVLVPDTDADGIPDRLDLLYGLDPLVWDYDRDADQDGIPNGWEVEWHLNPRIPQTDSQARARYRYDRPEVGQEIDGRRCYEFEARRIKLAPTLRNESLPQTSIGYNDIRLYILENMSDNLSGTPLIRTACVRARYVPPSLKSPASGTVTLSEADFHYLPAQDPIFADPAVASDLFDPEQHCILAE